MQRNKAWHSDCVELQAQFLMEILLNEKYADQWPRGLKYILFVYGIRYLVDFFTPIDCRVFVFDPSSKWLTVMSWSLPTMRNLEMEEWTTWTARSGHFLKLGYLEQK